MVKTLYLVADPHSGKQNRGSKLSGEFYNGTNPIHWGLHLYDLPKAPLPNIITLGGKVSMYKFLEDTNIQSLTISKVYKKEYNIKTKGSSKQLSRSEAGGGRTEWETSLSAHVQRKWLTIWSGGSVKALMFWRSNSDFVQKNSIRSAKNFQGRENCKGIFLFWKKVTYLIFTWYI